MKNTNLWSWDGKEFLNTTWLKEQDGCPEDYDYTAWLKERGWQYFTTFPENEGAAIEFAVYRHNEMGFLVETILAGQTIGSILCTDGCDLLSFLRHYLPLVRLTTP